MWYKDKHYLKIDPNFVVMQHYFRMLFDKDELEDRMRREWIIAEWTKGSIQIVSLRLDDERRKTRYIS